MKSMTIILEDSEGALAKISRLLGEADINITDIDAEEVCKTAVINLAVEPAEFEAAENLLRKAGYQVIPQEALLIQVEDKPGSLAKIAVRLADAKVNVRSMRIIVRQGSQSICAIVPEPYDIAAALLENEVSQVNVLGSLES
jgi:hypothetical protein